MEQNKTTDKKIIQTTAAEEQFFRTHSVEEQIDRFTRQEIGSVLIPHISTGIAGLDTLLGGGLTAGVIMLGGHSGMGKSTLALQIAQNISAAGIPVYGYFLETSKIGVIAKALSRQVYLQTDGTVSLLAAELLYEGSVNHLDRKRWEEIEQARQTVKEECRNLLLFEDRKADPISGLRIYREVSEHAQKGNAVVMVDYLQILESQTEQNAARAYLNDPRTMLDANIRILRQLAYEMEIPVVVINSLNRSSYGRAVSVSAFKESGAIEYSADVVLAMQFALFSDHGELKNGEAAADREKSKNPRIVDLVALKQRYGRCGMDARVRFTYYPGNDVFLESTDQRPVPASRNAGKRTRTRAVNEMGAAEDGAPVRQQTIPDPDYDAEWIENCR
ncbi:MAG: DnaB-like helicase C-terminal domain-containing protein [Lachnospiraceae bacterium]